MTPETENFFKTLRNTTLTDTERGVLRAQLESLTTPRATHLSPLSGLFFRIPVTAFALVAIIATSTAFAAEQALPGDVLYPIKIRVTEEARELLAVTTEQKADWEITRAERRMEEATQLLVEDRLSDPVRSELSARIATHTETAQRLLTKESPDEEAPEQENIYRTARIESVVLAQVTLLDRPTLTIARAGFTMKTEKEDDPDTTDTIAMGVMNTEKDPEPETLFSTTRAHEPVDVALSAAMPVDTGTPEARQMKMESTTGAPATPETHTRMSAQVRAQEKNFEHVERALARMEQTDGATSTQAFRAVFTELQQAYESATALATTDSTAASILYTEIAQSTLMLLLDMRISPEVPAEDVGVIQEIATTSTAEILPEISVDLLGQ